MIKKVQIKIVCVIMVLISFLVLAISGAVITKITINKNEDVHRTLQLSMKNYRNPSLFEDRSDNINNSRSFAIELDNNYAITYMRYETNTFSHDEIIDISNKIINLKKDEGNYKNIEYLRVDDGHHLVIVGIDREIENALYNKLVLTIIVFTIIGLAFLLIVIILISFWIIKPIKETFDKQKRFISDSSHELKTPLSVINANVDALSSEIGNNDLLNNIKSQTLRMNSLVLDMLQLAKLEEKEKIINDKIDLSKLVQNEVLPYEALAFENNKKLSINVEQNIEYRGNEEDIKKLINILVDNAIKHSSDNAKIKINLKKDKKHIIFDVYNTGCTFKDSEREKIFERFYRSDLSRNRVTGSSGLGLSIAKAIVESNNLKIKVDSEENKYTKFIVEFN